MTCTGGRLFALLFILVSYSCFNNAVVSAAPQDSDAPHAFASLLCDDLTLPAIEVLVASVRAAGHLEPFLVLIHPGVSSSTRETLGRLDNVRVLEADPLPYPFDTLGGRVHIHKPCRFLKLRLWGLLTYSKIVFLDADTMVRTNVGELFDMPAFSAVKDPVGMNYNTGVLVLEPCKHVHSLLIHNYARVGSYNVGDQGALNALLDFAAWNALPKVYNAFHSAPARALENAKIIHFSGDSKPWAFWNTHGKGRISPALHHEWCTHARDTPTAACHMNGNVHGHDAYLEELTVHKHYPEDTQETEMTVLLATYDRDEWRDLATFFGELPYVRDVFVVWHKMDRPHEEGTPGVHPKVQFIYPTTDSLNNRFLADRITTDCVYVCDDDVYPSRVALAQGFYTWRQHPYRLVGFYPRYWSSAPPEYKVNVNNGYNIVLTKGMYTHRVFLNTYTLFMPRKLTNLVNTHKNCEDILFNMMAVGMTGLPPVAVLADKKIRDVGRYNGISGRQDGSHLRSRDVCIHQFMAVGQFDRQPASFASLLPASYKNYVIEGHEQGL